MSLLCVGNQPGEGQKWPWYHGMIRSERINFPSHTILQHWAGFFRTGAYVHQYECVHHHDEVTHLGDYL